jgi:hypothetical protein
MFKGFVHDKQVRFPLAMLKKAETLLQTKNVFQLSCSAFAVDGFNGSYLVKILPSGALTCTCPGFKERKVCSHIIAVSLMLNPITDKSIGG